MAIVNGVSTYRNIYKGNITRNSQTSQRVDYARKLQEEAKKRNIAPDNSKRINNTVAKRNPEFDKMNEQQKKMNAMYLNSSVASERAKGISHIMYEDNPMAVRDNNGNQVGIRDEKFSREENIKRYQDSFKNSAYTPQNKYLSDLNAKEDNELINDEYLRNLPDAVKKQYGIIDGRAVQRYPVNGQDLLADITTATTNYNRQQGGNVSDLPEITTGPAPSSSKFSSKQAAHEAQMGHLNYSRSRENTGSVIASKRASEETNRINSEITTATTNSNNAIKDKTATNKAARDQYITNNLNQRLQSPKISQEYRAIQEKANKAEQRYKEMDFIRKYMSAEERFLQANDGRRGNSRDHYMQQRLGMSHEAASAQYQAYRKSGGYSGGKYHWLKSGGNWVGDAYKQARDAKKELEDYTQGVKDTIGGEYDQTDEGIASAAELNQFTNDQNQQTADRKEELQSTLAKNLVEINNRVAREQSIYNTNGGNNGARGGESGGDPMQEIIDSYRNPSTDSPEIETQAFETVADAIAREKFDTAQRRQREDKQRQMSQYEKQRMEYYENKARSAKTKSAANRYLAQKQNILNGGMSQEMSQFDESQAIAKQRYQEDFLSQLRNSLLLKEESEKNKTFDLADMEQRQKANYVLEFMKNDKSDPNTAVARAMASYSKAIKMDNEKEKKSELQLGSQLDQALELFTMQESGVELTPEQQEMAVNPIQAYEWLRAQGAEAGAADKMLKFRGISEKLIRPQIEEYYRDVLGFDDDEIKNLIREKDTRSMERKYLDNELSDEEAALFLERKKNLRAEKSAKRRYDDGDMTQEEEDAYLGRRKDSANAGRATKTYKQKTPKQRYDAGEMDEEEKADYLARREEYAEAGRAKKTTKTKAKKTTKKDEDEEEETPESYLDSLLNDL